MEKNLENRLKTKDLINIGIFGVMYVLMVVVVASVLGFVPILYIFVPFFVPLFGGIIYMILCLRAPKTGAVFITTILTSLMFLSSSIYAVIWMLILGVISEIILLKNGYKSLKRIKLSYLVFGCVAVGPFLAIWFARSSFFEQIYTYGGQEYADKLAALLPWWIIFVLIAIAVLGAFFGTKIGERLLAKHFKKAGVV